MITSLYTTKGGAGKSSSIICLCSAIAEQNARGGTEQHRVCVVDADPQGSVMLFNNDRVDKGLPAHGIDFVQLLPDENSQVEVQKLADEYDHVLIDLPGYYTDELAVMAMQSHVVLVPTGLTKQEVLPALDTMEQLQDLAEQFDFAQKSLLLLTKGHRDFQFEQVSAKAIYRELVSAGYPITEAKLSDENAVALMGDSGIYLFEMEQEGGKSKSHRRSQENARLLWAEVLAYGRAVEAEENSNG